MQSLDFGIWEQKFRTLLHQRMDTFDPAHDLLHFERVAHLAKVFAREEGALLEVVTPAAWLHDWVNFPKNDPRRSQASRLSGESVKNLLRELSYPEEFLDPIRHAIEAHSFSAGIPPQTLEAKVVQDADRLDALGAIGIARCFATAGILKTPFYCPEDPFCEERPPNDRSYSLDHFFVKLFKIGETLHTRAGRREAQRRVAFMRTFLSELRSEVGPIQIPRIS